MYCLVFTESYEKRAARFLKRYPEIRGQYERTLRLLELNPWHPSLRLPRIHLGPEDLYSASINMSYRITLELLMLEDEIILIDVGTHDDL